MLQLNNKRSTQNSSNMKSSVHKIFYFITSILAICILLVAIFIVATNAKAKSFRIDHDKTKVFMGDSHMRYAVNDSLLTHSINLGNSSESVYFSYYKLKRLLQANPSIETIYWGFSYHNISSYYNEYIYGKYAQEIAANYFYLLPFTEQLQMIKWNSRRWPSFVNAILKSGVKVWRKENTFEGGFDNPYINTTINKETMNRRLNFQYYTNGNLNSFSSLNLNYFENFVEHCKAQHVELVIVNTPMHPYYKAKIPQAYIDKYDSLTQHYNLRTIDLTILDLPNHSFQPEGDLVSMDGALRATEEIKTIIE